MNTIDELYTQQNFEALARILVSTWGYPEARRRVKNVCAGADSEYAIDLSEIIGEMERQ